MSFSGKVKEELAEQIPSARHCQIAELAAILSICGSACIRSDEKVFLKMRTESLQVARKCFTLLVKTFNIIGDISVRSNRLSEIRIYEIVVKNADDCRRVLQAVKMMNAAGEIEEELDEIQLVVREHCCKRSFLRGAFLAAGSISDPSKQYHFEIAVSCEAKAQQIQRMMAAFDLDAKIVQRKKMYVVYLKEGNQIVDALNVMEAHRALMELENVRIVKDMRNSVNRKVNCETANLNKTVSAAVKQLEDIRFIAEHMELDQLPEGLQEIAEKRMEYPDASLKELGNLLEEPLGKSGVNHRLRKLGEIADKMRECQETSERKETND